VKHTSVIALILFEAKSPLAEKEQEECQHQEARAKDRKVVAKDSLLLA